MYIAAFESSTNLASVSILNDDLLLSQKTSDIQKAHSEFMNSALESCLGELNLNLSNIDKFCCGIGPGSFTGIRVSVNIVRSLSYLLGKEFYIKDSLAILNFQVQQIQKNSMTLAMINAYKNMVYFAFYNSDKIIYGPSVSAVSQLEKVFSDLKISKPIICVGDGFKAYESIFTSKLRSLLIRKDYFADFPYAANLGLMSLQENSWTKEWNSIIPLYIRASEAEENLKK